MSAQSWAERKRRRLAECVVVEGRRINPNVPVHGVTTNGYTNYWCRCWECSAVWADEIAARRAVRAERRVRVDGRMVAVDAAEHGTAATYQNHRCRCEPCVQAAASRALQAATAERVASTRRTKEATR